MSAPAAPTEKLYWSDVHALAFTTRGATLGAYGGKASLVLPQTLFYPEGGGQLGDLGTLAIGDHRVPIADTQVDGGVIHHVLGAPLPAELAELLAGAATSSLEVRGAVDEARRRDHMVQHTAQHALSRALADAARADTVSARLGLGSCTIDVSKPGIADADLHRAEDLANAVVMGDVAVLTTFPTPEELATLALRKAPNAEKSAAGVRVFAIEGFDLSPCGGTHCSRTGQIGQIRIVATEKYKGMLRLTFQVGRCALADARARHDVLAGLAGELTCGPQDVAAAVTKLRAETKALRDRLESSRTELAELVAGRALATLPPTPGPHVLPLARALDDLAGLRALANELTKDPRVVALVGGADEGSGEVVLVVQRGADARLDCGAFVMAQARAGGGRGGGRPERAEGRFPRGPSLAALAADARAALPHA
ncbi:DHHA1 domain-containing protein [soil metagenome]